MNCHHAQFVHVRGVVWSRGRIELCYHEWPHTEEGRRLGGRVCHCKSISTPPHDLICSNATIVSVPRHGCPVQALLPATCSAASVISAHEKGRRDCSRASLNARASCNTLHARYKAAFHFLLPAAVAILKAMRIMSPSTFNLQLRPCIQQKQRSIETVRCPGDCSGHGTCMTVADMSRFYGPDYSHPGTGGDGVGPAYGNWDAHSTTACFCDDGHFGADCSNREYLMILHVPAIACERSAALPET